MEISEIIRINKKFVNIRILIRVIFMRFSSQQRNNFIITTLIVLGIFVVANILSYRFFHRFDLTSEKEFSVSESTKKILKGLDDIITVRAYFSRELPAELLLLRQEVNDVFDEYRNYSRGKLKFEFIDPATSDEKKQEALGLGIPQIQFNVREKDKFEMRNGFLGVVIMYEDRKEAIPVIQNTGNLEYELTSSIKKVLNKETNKIGFATGNGELDRYQEMKYISQDLEKQYRVEEIDLTKGDLIANDIKTLVIAAPTTKFSERQLFIIDQYLMNGGNLLLALDSVNLNEGLTVEENNTDLDLLLGNYGLNFKKDLVLDISNETVNFSQGFMTFFVNYPFWPKVVGSGLNRENVITSKLEALVFPWAASLEIAASMPQDNQLMELAKTTDKSWEVVAPYVLNPQQDFIPTGEVKSRIIAVLARGKFESYFKSKQIPVKLAGESSVSNVESKLDSTDKGQIVLITDGDFMTDGFLQRFPDNGVFFENIIDYVSLGEDLIGIRSRGVSDRGIGEISEDKKNTIKYGNIFGVTGLVILIGIFRYYSRRRKGFADEL